MLQAPVDLILPMFWTLLTRFHSQIPSARPLDLAFTSDILLNPPQQSSTTPTPSWQSCHFDYIIPA
jgi:hypothetical protein